MTKKDVEKKIQEMMLTYEIYEKKVNEMAALKERVEKKIKELQVTIKSIQTIGENHEQYILPIAPMVFVEGNVKHNESVFVNIGSNVIVKMNIQNAISYLEKVKKSGEEQLSRIENMLTESLNQMEYLRKQLESLGVI